MTRPTRRFFLARAYMRALMRVSISAYGFNRHQEKIFLTRKNYDRVCRVIGF